MDEMSFLEFLGFAENAVNEAEIEDKIVELPQEQDNYEQDESDKESESDILDLLGII